MTASQPGRKLIAIGSGKAASQIDAPANLAIALARMGKKSD